MVALGIILARAGSRGLRDKCVRPLLGRPLIEYTLDHALASRRLTAVVLTTDSTPAAAIARRRGVEVIDRPPELASDTATVDAAARHAVQVWEERHRRRAAIVVLLYANVPVRAPGVIDRVIEHLAASGASSVRTVAPVGKFHPDWLHRLDGDRLIQFRPNSIYRRQDLQPLYYHDGAVVAVTRQALFDALRTPHDAHAFFGSDRRAIVQRPEDTVDVDGLSDLYLAEALLRARSEASGAAVAEPEDQTGARPDNQPPAERHGGVAPLCTATQSYAPRRTPPPVVIDQRLVGPGQPTFIIAEAGVNHDGSVDRALRLVDVAAEAGADAVKFQVFCATELTTPTAATAAYQRAGGVCSQRELLAALELSPDDFARIRAHCAQRGIRFLATPFSPGDVDRLMQLDVRAIKIASTDLNNVPLLRRAADTGLPLIVSTGAATEGELRGHIGRLCAWGLSTRLILLHCVSSYPTPPAAANLRAIGALERLFGVPAGFSDHTTSTHTGAWAVACGACVLEKHFTLDRDAPGPDHAMSLDPAGLRAYIAAVREAETALGSGRLGMTALEAEVRALARKSLVAACDLAAGTVLRPEMVAIKRPAGGIEPEHFEAVIGRRVGSDVKRDTLLTWDLLQ